MVSVLILTWNEEADLPDCLESVSWSDDIHVFDSCSTDQTVSIAEAAGAHVRQRPFDDYATHRNAALHECTFRHPWVFLLDADERPTPELSREVQEAAQRTEPHFDGYRVHRRDYLWGRWLKHAQISPFYIRLVRPERSSYTRAINEVLNVDGDVGDLHAPLLHYPFSKGISHWLRKHDRYSTMEAELIAGGTGLKDPSWRKALLSRDFHERRLHGKALFYRLPFRPVVKWLYMMCVRRAFLDGGAGLTYAALQSIYEYLIVLKTRELRLAGAGIQKPTSPS